MSLQTIVRRTVDHRGPNGRMRYIYHFACGHIITRTSDSARYNDRIHCPKHRDKETRL